MNARPVIYDLTRLFTRVFNRTPNGIDRVDFAFANHFLAPAGCDNFGLITTPAGPRIFPQRAAREVIEIIRRHWGEESSPDTDVHLRQVTQALREASALRRFSKGRTGQFGEAMHWILRHGFFGTWAPRRLPEERFAYLNVSQYPIHFDSCMRWLSKSKHIDGVFFIHDLLPLQMPEYFRPSEYGRHVRRLATLTRRGRAAIVSSDTVREALSRYLIEVGRADFPIMVAPLAPDPIFSARDEQPSTLEGAYFLMCGTIEPRKNHLLILHVWRDLVTELGDKAPKLVLAGTRGWEIEHIIDLLQRSPPLRRHVVEVSGLPTPSLKRLMVGARALLMPSFAEGYGLPVIEAMAAGVPVIAADTPIFREIGDSRLTLIDPTDGPAWRNAIRAFAGDADQSRARALSAMKGYRGVTWPQTFSKVEAFLGTLQ